MAGYRAFQHYSSARSYARSHNSFARQTQATAYLKRREKEREEGRALCEILQVGDRVSYCHQNGFVLHLKVLEITPIKIVTSDVAHPEQRWQFGGSESGYPAKYAGCDVTWPSMLCLENSENR